MAIKDLNNKKTGDKLYANEWNDVMNEILAHFKNKRIHEDIVVTTGDENLLIYKDTNDVEHLFVLYPKEGTTYGELFILSVNSSQLDEYNTYSINNVSSEENTIDFEISYSRAVNIDGRIDHYETTEATITALELPQGLLVIGTPTDSTVSIKVPENQEYNTKNYLFTIKVSMDPEHEDALNTKTFTVSLTLNAKDATYSDPVIDSVTLQSEDSTALDNGNIISKGGKLVYEVNYHQMYGETSITNGGEVKLHSSDVNGDPLIYTWDDNSKILEITISKNNTDNNFTYSDFKIRVEMTQDETNYESDYYELTKYTQNKRVLTKTTYSEISDVTLTYPNNNIISLNGTSQNGIDPSFSFKAKTVKTYDNGISESVTPKPLYTSIPQNSGITKLFTENSGSYQGTETFDTTTGKIVKTSSNPNPAELNVAKVYLTLGVNSTFSNSNTVTIKQAAAPSAYYAYVSTGQETQFNLRPLQNGENNVTLDSSEGNGVFFFSSNPLFNNYQGGKIVYTSYGYESSPQDFPLALLNYTVDSTGLKGGSTGTVYYALTANIYGITTGDKFKVTII